MEHIKGPDFPGGGMHEHRRASATPTPPAAASVQVRARAHVEPIKGGKEAIIVSELPFRSRRAATAA